MERNKKSQVKRDKNREVLITTTEKLKKKESNLSGEGQSVHGQQYGDYQDPDHQAEAGCVQGRVC